MTDVTVANTGSAPAPVAPALAEKVPPSFAAQNEWSASDAARLLASRRQQKQAEPAPVAPEPPQPEQAEQELAPEANAAASQEAPGETEVDDAAPEQVPPIERPRSWAKELDEGWAALPRAAQEAIVRAERERDSSTNRKLQQASESQKAYEAQREQMEKARQEFEAKTAFAMQLLEREQLRDFPDIKTFADIERMAAEDPFRKIQWDTHQQKMQVAAWETQQAEQRKAQEQQTKWAEHVRKENDLAAELIPELADKVKGPALTQRAAERLNELGFKPDELAELASGKKKLSIYDHRIQRLIFSDLKLSDIQSAKNAVVSKPVPPVARPGTAKPAANSNASKIQALERELSTAPGHRQAKLMAEIRTLRRAGTSR